MERRGTSTLRWHAPPGTDYTLLVQNPTRARLVLTIDDGPSAELEGEALVRGWSASLVGGTWNAGPAGAVGASIELTWPTDLTGASDPSASDDDLRRQLEALGYVD